MQRVTSIMVGVDYTACSKAALSQGVRLAKAFGARVQAVHVIDTLVAIELEEALSVMQANLRDGLLRDAAGAWRDFAAGVPGAGDLVPEVVIDNRVRGVLAAAARAKADLIVLGAFGSRPAAVGMGTMATACVRRSEIPVLLVRETQAGPFREILACVDFSATSARALDEAVALARRENAKVHVLHVFDAPWHKLHYRAPTPEASPAFQKQYRDGIERRLSEFATPVCTGVPFSVELVDTGGHRSAIADHARAIGADLIVLGTRGRSNLRDVLLGSTAEKVLRDAPCSVLTVRPPA